MENEVIVTKKGQTTIPARLRRKLKIEKGTKLRVVETKEGVLFMVKNQVASGFVSSQEIKKCLISLREKDRAASYFIALDRISTDNVTVMFDEPIIATVSFNDNVYSCQNVELGLLTMSFKLEECIRDFEQEVLFLWNEYGKEDDAKLTSDAKELKAKVLRHIRP